MSLWGLRAAAGVFLLSGFYFPLRHSLPPFFSTMCCLTTVQELSIDYPNTTRLIYRHGGSQPLLDSKERASTGLWAPFCLARGLAGAP